MYFRYMEIKDAAQLAKAKAQLQKLQAQLSDTVSGELPEEEALCVELFDAIEKYYINKAGGDIRASLEINENLNIGRVSENGPAAQIGATYKF